MRIKIKYIAARQGAAGHGRAGPGMATQDKARFLENNVEGDKNDNEMQL